MTITVNRAGSISTSHSSSNSEELEKIEVDQPLVETGGVSKEYVRIIIAFILSS